jgi:uncharacterized protein YukE
MKELVKKADDMLVKIHRLLDRQNELTAELAECRRVIRQLNDKLKMQQTEYKELEQQVTVKQIGKHTKEHPDERKIVRQKLNEYLRELDRIIAKLSAEG